MNPALALSLREFFAAYLSLFLLLRTVAFAGGGTWLPSLWHEWALPLGMAAMFATFRHAQRSN